MPPSLDKLILDTEAQDRIEDIVLTLLTRDCRSRTSCRYHRVRLCFVVVCNHPPGTSLPLLWGDPESCPGGK
ncbi:hypothetical protein K466DRAFT_591770 [Polyporus arcularius HHB13444]|uniref:Uncharacterized protein n=1 Tax=Polyporus arcularius HHB13444 TaxID=1314778 RepID=A0A5C3NSP9_9APHY|nr:hypothetical protein K466DRAFT_591770 [Polyporus arcularius HHB13444]